MNLFYQPQIPSGVFFLDPDESRHAVKVLRKKKGDTIRITDGQGLFYDAIITKPDAHECAFEINNRIADTSRKFRIHIAISPTKNIDRIEWFLEKSVELGIDDITLMACAHTERQNVKYDRLRKMAVSAMKQSLKATLPELHPLTSFENVVKAARDVEKFIAYVDNQNTIHLKNVATPGSNSLVLIGPEGDFSTDELLLAETHGYKKVSLGSSRLRTETAGLAACLILNLANTP